jgi:hypothetical protein
MEQEPYFHFFRNYETTIVINHIGQKINIGAKTLSLTYVFTMNFDNKRYKFVGYSEETEQIPFDMINDIQQVLLYKERPVTLLGIKVNPKNQRMSDEITIDLKFTNDELMFLNKL